MKNLNSSFIRLIVFFAILAFTQNLMAQNEIEKEDKTSAEQIEKSYQIRASKLNKAQAAKLKQVQQEATNLSGEATFKVGATEVFDRPLNELVGSEKPQPAFQSKSESDAHEKENQVATQAAAADIKTKKQSDAPDPTAVGSGSGVGLPASYYFAGTPVKNQGSCGSGWAFHAAALYEHSYKRIYGGANRNASEQDILACGRNNQNVDAGNCNGGLVPRALDYFKYTGVATEASYPYNTGQANNCQEAIPGPYRVHTWTEINAPSAATLKTLIYNYGAVVATFKVVNSFLLYTSGIYNGYPNTNASDINAYTLITGWNDIGGYWIIKQPWGSSWGISGRAYVKYGHMNLATGNVYYTLPRF